MTGWAEMRKLRIGSQACGYTAEDKAAIQRLRKWMLAVLMVFLALSPLGIEGSGGVHGVAAAVIAVVKGLCFTAVMVLGWNVALRGGDEYRRALLWRSMAWGTAATMALASVWGYMEIAGISLPKLPLLVLPVVLMMTTAIAKVVVFRRERAAM